MHEPLGHADVSTTMIYTHALKVGGMGVRSPLDVLARAMAPPAPPGLAVRGREPAIPADVHRLAVRPAEVSALPAFA